MDIMSVAVSIAGVFGVPVGYAYKKIADANEKIASQEATLAAINTTLTDLKTGQKSQTDKLDRLIERFL